MNEAVNLCAFVKIRKPRNGCITSSSFDPRLSKEKFNLSFCPVFGGGFGNRLQLYIDGLFLFRQYQW